MTEPGRPSSTAGGGPATTRTIPALRLENISKSFGGHLALDDVGFDVYANELHALLGENGAGKSTLMNVAAGLYAPDHGIIEVAGEPVVISGPADAKTLRIGMVHQHYKLVKPFNALQNILLANSRGGYRNALADIENRVTEQIQAIGFEIDLEKPVGSLSIAEQQRVEILKVLVAGIDILILDEPTAVLTDEEGERLLKTVRNLADNGTAVVLVTHKLAEALNHCDRITVMRGGKIVEASFSPEDVTPVELTTMIVGEQVVEEPEPATATGTAILKVRELQGMRDDGLVMLKGASFDVRSGEIYGIAGVGGNGQTELALTLTGLSPVLGGQIYLDGVGDITGHRADQCRRHGIVSIPADRHTYGMAGDLSIADNYCIHGVNAGKYGTWARTQKRKMRASTWMAMKQFEVHGVNSDTQKAGLLSGGNAQKLVIAREFSGDPKLVIAHSPSRGLDVRAAAAVHKLLRRARDGGAGVLLISEDLDEVMLLADRIGVMNRGAIAAEFDAPADRHAVGRAMIGHG